MQEKTRNKIKQAAKEATNEHWEFATKPVRDSTHGDTTNNKTSKDNGGWNESKRATITNKVKLKEEWNTNSGKIWIRTARYSCFALKPGMFSCFEFFS